MSSPGYRFYSLLAGTTLLCAGVLYGQSQDAKFASAGGTSLAFGSTSSFDEEMIARGEYLAIAGNCATCHTAPGGEAFAGGLPFKTDFGTIYSTNISSDPETGIGGWTLEEFQRSLRKGIRADGKRLYPAFPYTSFTKISDEDATALYAYMMTVPAVEQANRENDMPFPFNQRWAMGFWNLLFLDEGAYEPAPDKSEEWNRGAYLVESLAHCSSCHTPRNALGAEKSSAAMIGGIYIDKVPTGHYRKWSPPNLTQASSGLGNWSVDDISAYLKTGKNDHAASFGPMNEVIMNSTRHLEESDVRAMAIYLKSLEENEHDFAQDISEHELGRAQTLYDLHCGTCHQPTGLGADETGARLAGSPIVQASDPASLLNVIIYGPEISEPPPPVGEWRPMPSFNNKIDDEEMAILASYLRYQWGNKGGRVTVEQVAEQRPPFDIEE